MPNSYSPSNYLQSARRALRLRGPLANNPAAEILHTLLGGLLCWAILNGAVITPFFAVHKTGSMVISTFAGLAFSAALAFLHGGLFRTASLVYLGGLWLAATLTIFWNGGIHALTMVFYIALPISAAWLLGYRATLVSAGVCLGSALAMALLEQNGVRLPRYVPGKPIATWYTILAAMIVAAVPVAHVLRILKEALAHSMVDITERKQAEATLRESEQRFRNMADTAPVLIWVSGPDKLRTFLNKVWLEFRGRAMELELFSGWAEGVHPDDLDRYLSTYSVSFEARQPFQMEYRLRRRDGEYRWMLENGVPRLDPGNVFLGYIGSCLDITDLKRMHEEDLTRQKLETVGTLASGIAHDFNNLLGGVLAYSELGLAVLAEGANPREELLKIRGAATRGAEIVRQLMVYAGGETEVAGLVDVSPVVEDMLEFLKVSVSKHATVETELSKHLPAVRASPSQVRQVLMNLLYNASEALGHQDGVIRVTTGLVTIGPDSSLATSERMAVGDYVKLEVSDTGRGMTPDVQARIFEPFFTTKATGSHGLGLSAVHGIIQRLNGTILLSSAPGKGTTFQIMLPCEESTVEATHGAIAIAKDETLVSRAATVLVVEDEDMLRQAVSKILRKKGLCVLEARDGSAALDVIRARKGDIDVLLLDITLPGASSREVYEEAKRLRPGLPVIVTSANSEEMAAAALATGIERFLRKPFSLGDLTDMLRQILYY